ncbi:MAG: hypothetical protein KDD15_32225, partial [Lewinella sp.]|nr:hypothetical protein [Lewinella sp.]
MSAFSLSTPLSCEYYLDLRKSKLLLRKWVTAYNDGRPLRERLRTNHITLALELLELYRKCLWKRQSVGELLLPGSPLPYLSTNNVQLGQLLRCSERTIQNWRQRLKIAGVITEEIWHGTNAGYEVRLHPAVMFLTQKGHLANQVQLFGMNVETTNARSGAAHIQPDVAATNERELLKTPAETVENACKRQHEQGAVAMVYGEKNPEHAENFSPYCTLPFQDTNQLNQLEVLHCGERAETDHFPTHQLRPDTGTGYETDSEGTELPPQVARRPPEVGVRGEGVRGEEHGWRGSQRVELIPATFSVAVADLPQQLGRRIWQEVSKVWETALEQLYQGEWIAETERERAKARLAEYYIYAKPENYASGTVEICERIRLVRKWIDRGRKQEENRWVPIPSVYFDYRNPKGFRRTKSWFKK